MKAIFITLLSLAFSLGLSAQTRTEALDFSLENIASLGLPVVVVTTENGEEPTCDIVEAPPGEDGITITNVTKIPGRILIVMDTDTVYDSGEYQKGLSGMKIRIRGNTSARWDKKPFKVNLQQPADLLLRGDERYADCEWALLKVCDLFEEIGLRINNLCGMQWTPAMCHVNLFVNYDYRGIYTLVETVKRNNDCRLSVADDGYIFERDPYWWNMNDYVSTTSSHEYTFKYPDRDELAWTDMEYVRELMETVEASIRSGTYPELIDVDSWASWLLAHDMLGTWDAAGSNIFLTKFDSSSESKILMGNLWDFDTIMHLSTNSWSNVHKSNFFYFPQLFDSPNKAFTRAYKAKWEEMKERMPAEFYDKMELSVIGPDNQGVSASNPYEMARWKYSDAISMEELWKDCKRYLHNRSVWLDNSIARLDDVDGIILPSAEVGDDNTFWTIYGQNLGGNRPTQPGVYVCRGKKILVK